MAFSLTGSQRLDDCDQGCRSSGAAAFLAFNINVVGDEAAH